MLFPEFVRLLPQLPGAADLGTPAVVRLLGASPSAGALARAGEEALVGLLATASEG